VMERPAGRAVLTKYRKFTFVILFQCLAESSKWCSR
jgi:hypothetical protein